MADTTRPTLVGDVKNLGTSVWNNIDKPDYGVPVGIGAGLLGGGLRHMARDEDDETSALSDMLFYGGLGGLGAAAPHLYQHGKNLLGSEVCKTMTAGLKSRASEFGNYLKSKLPGT